MTSILRTFATAALAVLLIVTLAPVAASAAEAPGDSAARGGKLGKCKDKGHGAMCVKVLKRMKPDFRVGYADEVRNTTDHAVEGSCKATTQVKTTWGLNISISGKFKAWVFSEVQIQAGYEYQKETTSGTEVGTTFTVPAKSVTQCDRGTVVERFRLRLCSVQYSPYREVCDKAKMHAPARNSWRLSSHKL